MIPATQQAAQPQMGFQQPFHMNQQGDLFDMLDRNHDGVLTQDELEQAMQAQQHGQQGHLLFPQPGQPVVSMPSPQSTVVQPSMAQPTRMQPAMGRPDDMNQQGDFFDMLDRNHDGVLTQDELEQATQAQQHGQQAQLLYPQRGQPAVSMPPSPQPTVVQPSMAQPTKMQPAMGRPVERVVQTSVPSAPYGRQASGTNDQNQQGDLFDMLDRNHDGVLTQDEFEQAMQAQRPGQQAQLLYPQRGQPVVSMPSPQPTVVQPSMVQPTKMQPAMGQPVGRVVQTSVPSAPYGQQALGTKVLRTMSGVHLPSMPHLASGGLQMYVGQFFLMLLTLIPIWNAIGLLKESSYLFFSTSAVNIGFLALAVFSLLLGIVLYSCYYRLGLEVSIVVIIMILLLIVWNLLPVDALTHVFNAWGSPPVAIILTCIGVVLLYALAIIAMHHGYAPAELQGLGGTVAVWSGCAMLLSVCLILQAMPIINQAQLAESELISECSTGQRTRFLHETSTVLGMLRASSTCALETSVESCNGFMPSREARVLKNMESSLRCSGFCFMNANATTGYPPTLFSQANYQASCDGRAARFMHIFVKPLGEQIYYEGILIVAFACLLALLRYCGCCMWDLTWEETYDTVKQPSTYSTPIVTSRGDVESRSPSPAITTSYGTLNPRPAAPIYVVT